MEKKSRHVFFWTLAGVLFFSVQGEPPRTEGAVAIDVLLEANREVFYVNEPIRLRVTFLNYEERVTFVNTSPKTLSEMVFTVALGEQTFSFTSFHEGDDVFRYALLSGYGQISLDCTLVEEKKPLKGDFANFFYGDLPDQPGDAAVRVTYRNEDTGRRAIPFWTGRLTSEPFQITIAER